MAVISTVDCTRQKPARFTHIWFGGSIPYHGDTFNKDKLIAYTTIKMASEGADKNYDIALIKLAKMAPKEFKPIAILDSEYQLIPYTELTVAGYGNTDLDSFDTNYHLNKVKIPLLEYVDNIFTISQPDTHGAYNGDSGGPAYLEKNNELFLVGTVRGATDNSNHVGTFMNLSKFKDFILKSAKEMKAIPPTFSAPRY